MELGAAFEDGDEKVEPIDIKATGGAFGVAEVGLGGEGLDFDEYRAVTLEGGEDDGAVGIGALSEESGGWVLNFFEAGAQHFEDSDFVGGAEAVFDGADGLETAVAVAFEVEDDVDEMLEDFGAG